MKMLFTLFALLPSLAFADVSVPRSMQYLWTTYDVSRDGGASTAHSLGAYMPAGAVVVSEYVYINTQFAASGTESLAFQCAGTDDLMAFNAVKSITADQVLQAHLGTTNFNNGSASAVIGADANATKVALNAGYGSIPTVCEVKAVVQSTSGFTPYTAGKATLIVQYFLK
jgi:hypothetical protein